MRCSAMDTGYLKRRDKEEKEEVRREQRLTCHCNEEAKTYSAGPRRLEYLPT